MKSILAFLSGGESDHAVLNAAFAVAGAFGAHVAAVLVEPAPDEVIYAADLYQSANERAETQAQQRNAAQLAFVLACRETNAVVDSTPSSHDAGVTASYRVETGQVAKLAGPLSHFADLVVLPSPEVARHGPFFDALAEILRDVRCPVLLSGRLPVNWGTAGVAIAWDASLTATHALSAALPILEKAGPVHLLTVQESSGQVVETSELLDTLSLHGIHAEPQLVAARGGTGDALIRAASDHGCAMLVLGAYGHNRTIEAMFGGTTDDAIRHHGNLAVLVAH